MGWTFYAHRGRKTIDLLKAEFERGTDEYKWSWLDHKRIGNVVYAVIEVKPLKAEETWSDRLYEFDADGTRRIIAVFLVSRKSHEFGYKQMDETMGPAVTDCPAHLIRLASPLKAGVDSYAHKWREKCLGKAES